MKKIKILGISGSLRKKSYNKSLLSAAKEFLPEGMEMEIFDLIDIPLYNGDVEDAGIPESVKIFKEKIASSDGVLISTPEYNYSIPGVLKNAIDWASRPPAPPLYGKPVAIMGATPGMGGTMRGQMALRHVAVNTNMIMMNKPEILVSTAQNKFNADGKLTDEKTKESISKFLIELRKWIVKLA